MNHLLPHIEALVFSSEQPLSLGEIRDCLRQALDAEVSKKELQGLMQQLMQEYQREERAFEMVEISEGYQFLTKEAYHETIGTLLKQKAKKRLSQTALETLAIIAYRQPATKSEVEAIRGVGCDYSIQKLLEKELLVILGRSDAPGKPLLYATSEKFMDYFGLKSIKDLPQLKDLKQPEGVGEAADAMTEHKDTKAQS